MATVDRQQAVVPAPRGRRGWAHAGRLLVVAAIGVAIGGVAGTAAPAAAACSPNPVACENSLPGAPASEWDITGAGDAGIQGFATDISVNVGGRIDFKVNTTASAYTINIYRLGFYGGNGARKIATVSPSATLPQAQPTCISDQATGNYDCGNWAVSASWQVPAIAVSGVYVARLHRADTNDSSHITFVVRDDASTSQMFFKTSDATWQAYNTYGGANFYPGGTGPDGGRAYKVSYNRPFGTRGDNSGRDFVFSNEYPMIRFLEQNGYDVSYTTDIDTDRRGQLITNHKAFLSVGHDEYWSGQERTNVEAARNAGVNLAFFSGNEAYWKTRWENSVDGSGTAYRTLVCYKETWAEAKIDPTSTWTGTWRDPRFSPPADGGRPENNLTGTQYMANSVDLAIQVPADQGKYRLWRNTSVATLAAGQVATLAPHTVGYESDEDVDNGFRPQGLIQLSTTTGSTPEYLRDFGKTTSAGTTTHHLTLYRAASGALVFSSGSIQWSWGLDSNHDGTQSPTDVRMRQATMNLFTDMGLTAATPASGLIVSAATDTQAPTVTITSPAAGTTAPNGSAVTVQGTATDLGGGKVAAVEVSTDGGSTWHRATGTDSWSYTFYATGAGSVTVKARGIDDNANIGATPATLAITLTGPTSLFGNQAPATPAANDSSAVTLGVRVTPQADGYITAVRFYKGTGNTGTHKGILWSSTGTVLASGTFSGETASGWQVLTFGSPVAVTAGTTYVASYYAPSGHYAADANAFAYQDIVASPLVAPRSGGNGVFTGGDGFPTKSYQFTNYYVDVLFVDLVNAPPTVVSVTPAANMAGVVASVHPSATFSKALDPASLQFTLKDSTNATVAGTAAYDSTAKAATFTPSAALAAGQKYTATVQASDPQGHAMDAPVSWSFTTDPYPNMAKLFGPDAVPAVAAEPDASAVTLGVKFVPSVSGSIVGVRFYQGPGNTGTHTGSLWSAAGTLLAKVTFTGETGAGWQTATFSSPVAVTAGQNYVATYYAPNGHYASSGNFFTSAWVNGPLTASATGNGVYQYGSDTFPTNSYHSTNYWVDPIFSPSSTPPPPPPPPPPGPTGNPVSIFTSSDTPATANWNDPQSIEVGVKFTADANGVITGVRFYKGTQNIGVHNGSLWSATGSLLATATFTGETASGWQTVSFSQPVSITAGTTYVASYSTSVGYYAATINAFSSTGLDRPPLHVPVTGGAYRYGGGFPDSNVGHNFWVDVIFQPYIG
jgi:hypothetical protein